MRTDGMTIAEKLDAYSAPDESGCRLWFGHKIVKGYGRIRIGRKMVLAHRLAWQEANGPIPDGLWVLHRCDVPACINPDHLFLGTHADNMADKKAKGRAPRGERSCFAKLTDPAVRSIRQLLAAGLTQGTVAEMFGVSDTIIGNVANRKMWSHVE